MRRRKGIPGGLAKKDMKKKVSGPAGKMVMANKRRKKTNGKSTFGMLSVKAGIDNNPNPTQADRIAGAKKKILAASGKKKGKTKMANGGSPGLYANIAAKKARIKAGSGEKMRKKGAKGAPKAGAFARAKKTARS